jgi:hypothetical protein
MKITLILPLTFLLFLVHVPDALATPVSSNLVAQISVLTDKQDKVIGCNAEKVRYDAVGMVRL